MAFRKLDSQVNMAFRKLERSCKTPPGWRLATVQEAKHDLNRIKQSNLLEEWDRARLLNGWIGGSAYNFTVHKGFGSCLGYMLVIETTAPEIVNTEDRNAALYSEIPKLSERGRSAALLLCCEDWNKEVLCWLIEGETEGDRARENAILESGETELASKVVSTIARVWQDVYSAKSKAPRTELSLASLADFKSNIRKLFQDFESNAQIVLKDLTGKTEKPLKGTMNQNSEQGNIANKILRISFSPIGFRYLNERRLTEYLEVFEDPGLGKSVPSTWEDVAQEVWDVTVETVLLASFPFLCYGLYDQLVKHSNPPAKRKTMDDCPTLASLIYYAYNFIKKTLRNISEEVETAAKEAKGDYKQFAEIFIDQWSLILRLKGKSRDALSTFLARAAKKGDVNLVKRLIDNGVQLSGKYKGKTAMHYAAELDDEVDGIKIAEILLKATEVDSEDSTPLHLVADCEDSTPLHLAAVEGHAQMCALLLQNNASVTSTDEDGQTPLHYAFWRKQQNEELVRVLISAEKEGSAEEGDRLVDVQDNKGETPLDFALNNNTPVKMVARLLSFSRQPESYFKKLDLSLYLREFSRMGYKNLVEKLLNEGADPFDTDDEGKTAVLYAAEGADEYVAQDIIEVLLLDKKKGSINTKKALVGDKYGRNVLHVAAFLGREELCHWLLRANRNMIDSKDRDGQSAIFYAVAGAHDDPNVLRVFISRKRGRNQAFVEDFSQKTPLHLAAARGKLEMVKALLSEISEEKRKRYVEAQDVLGQTALHKAAGGGHEEIVKVLLENGAHPLKERDHDSKTSLHFAAQADGEAAVRIANLLLDNCESDEQKRLLLFASPVGIGLRSNLSLEAYLEQEKSKILENLGAENLLRVAARLGDIDMTREFITRGANIALIRNERWIHTLLKDEQERVREVLRQIKSIVEQGTDKPALRDNLGRSPFAIGLAALFLNPFEKSPITVGISGEWGMGKSSVMVQTESILMKTAAQLAFTNTFQKNNFPGASESKLSVTGQARRRIIADAIERLDAESRDGSTFIGMSIQRVKNFTAKLLEIILQKSKQIRKKQAIKHGVSEEPSKALDPRNYSRLRKFWNALRGAGNESAPVTSQSWRRFNDFLENYEPKYHQIFKSLAIMDRRDMFEGQEESGSGNQTVGEMPRGEDSLQGTTPSILTVRYNAWQYRNETQAWAGLAVQITKELEATMTVAHKLRSCWMYNWTNRRNEISFGVVLPFFLALVVAIWFTTIAWLLLDTAHDKDIKKFKYGCLPVSMIVAACGLFKSTISFVRPISTQVVDYICLPDHSQKLGYHQKVIDDINFLKEQLCYRPSRKWHVFAFIWCCITWSWDDNYVPRTKICKMPSAFSDNLRIIVFVDDLDRCEENVILQVLSAVNLVLATCEINVVLSMENSMIQRAIIRKYGNNNSYANSKSNEELADKYLRKIVQLPLYLADPSDSESKDFLQCQLGRKGSTDPAEEKEKYTLYGRGKDNPKFQIEASDPKKPKLGREETKKDLAESGAKQQGALNISDTAQLGSVKTKEQETSEKSERVSPITQIYRNIQKCLCNVRRHNSQSGVEEAMIEIDHPSSIEQSIKSDEQVADDKDNQDERSLSLIISAMLIPKYSQGESKAFCFLHTRCTRSRKLPREWKCLMAYHRLVYYILSLSPDVIPVEGWQVQLIAWIFVCWQWRHLMTTLIQDWKNLGVLKKWKVVEESSGPSLREIVEQYIDERWPADKKSTTKKEDDAIDSLSTEEVEKTSDSLLEGNMTTIFSEEDKKGDDYFKEVLKKVLKEQEDMRDMLKMIMHKVFKEKEDNKGKSSLQQGTTANENKTIMKKQSSVEEEDNEGESSLQQYTTAEENQKTEMAKDEEEREEWNKLRETLRRYNVSMDGIQAFQKFRFYCEPGYLPWPLPKQP